MTTRRTAADPHGLSRRTMAGLLLSLSLLPALGWADTRRQVNSPGRVVTLFQGATDTAVALGVVPIGCVESWQDKPIYPYLRSALADVTLVGLETQPDLETIALLKPDLIVASRFRHQRIQPLLSALAPVLMLDDIYRYRQTLDVMAGALGREAHAARLHWALTARTSALRLRLRRQFGNRWPLTVSLVDVRADEIRSYLAPSFGGSVLASLGFVWNRQSREANGAMLQLGGVESVPVIDADVLFVLRQRSQVARDHYRRLRTHPLWQQLTAVRHGAVRTVDPVAWSLSGGMLGVFDMLEAIDTWLDEVAEPR
nr:iron-siderophore ABC transporter substrate-binding protein [Salinicola sp. S1-1-2]